MNISEVQTIMAACGHYGGGIDGLSGPQTRRAVSSILSGAGVGINWSDERRLIGAAQVLLQREGCEPGRVDGYSGNNTREAYRAWVREKVTGKPEVIPRPQLDGSRDVGSVLPRQSEMNEFYGHPETEIAGRLVTRSLKSPMKLDWDLGKSVSRVTLHKKCADSFVDAMAAVVKQYGIDKMDRLGLNRYAGGYVKRKMRGGRKWSTHAYGCAVDIYAAPNGLRTRCPEALFCGEEYRPFLDIMESHNWLPAIRLWGADAMHFQQARL